METYTVFYAPNDDSDWTRRDTYQDEDVACEMADEVLRVEGKGEVRVRNSAGITVYHITD